jgi:hypothetical protein
MKGKEIIHVTNIHVTILREWLRPSVPHGQLKENLFLPLFNTNFISKSFGGPLHNYIARTRGKARDILIL